MHCIALMHCIVITKPLTPCLFDGVHLYVRRAESELVQYVESAVPEVLATIQETGELPPELAAQLHMNIRVFVALQVAERLGEAVNAPNIAEASTPKPATVKVDSKEVRRHAHM